MRCPKKHLVVIESFDSKANKQWRAKKCTKSVGLSPPHLYAMIPGSGVGLTWRECE
jgi:hypothetical protein